MHQICVYWESRHRSTTPIPFLACCWIYTYCQQQPSYRRGWSIGLSTSPHRGFQWQNCERTPLLPAWVNFHDSTAPCWNVIICCSRIIVVDRLIEIAREWREILWWSSWGHLWRILGWQLVRLGLEFDWRKRSLSMVWASTLEGRLVRHEWSRSLVPEKIQGGRQNVIGMELLLICEFPLGDLLLC